MDTPESDPWSSPAAPPEELPELTQWVDDRPRSRGMRAWRGAKRGFRIASLIFGPIIGLIGLIWAVPMALAWGAGRGLAINVNLLYTARAFIVIALYGALIGAALGAVSPPDPKRLSRLRRPLRLRFWRKADPEKPVRRGIGWAWLLLWIFSGLSFVVLAIAYGFGVHIGQVVNRRLDAAVAAADADDPDWQLDDLMAAREPVPDEENSSLVVSEIVSLLPDNWLRVPTAPKGQPRPSLTELQEAFDRATETPDNVRLDPATAELIRRELQTHEKAVQLARTLSEYARGQHDLVLGPRLIDTRLPQAQEARTPGHVLGADAAIRAEDGDLDGALDSCRAIFGAARSIGDNPFIIAHLVHISIGSQALKSTRRVMAQGEPSEAALARMQQLILEEAKRPLLLNAMRGERATSAELIRRVGSGEVPISSISYVTGESAPSDDLVPQTRPWGRLMYDNQLALVIDWMNRAVAICRLPVWERPAAWKAWEAELERVGKTRFGPFTSALPALLIVGLSAGSTAESRYQSDLGATALLIASERHRRKHGSWPASADAIDPTLISQIPLDPSTGRAFVFEHRDGRLFIHSVGPNLKDEHGEYEPKRLDKGGPDDIGAIGWDKELRRQPPVPVTTNDP